MPHPETFLYNWQTAPPAGETQPLAMVMNSQSPVSKSLIEEELKTMIMPCLITETSKDSGYGKPEYTEQNRSLYVLHTDSGRAVGSHFGAD